MGIYGVHVVPALVNAIDSILSENNEFGIVAVACREGRRGIAEFLEAMKLFGEENAFKTVDIVKCSMCDVPSCFQNECNISRWDGKHTIYVYRRKRKIFENMKS